MIVIKSKSTKNATITNNVFGPGCNISLGHVENSLIKNNLFVRSGMSVTGGTSKIENMSVIDHRQGTAFVYQHAPYVIKIGTGALAFTGDFEFEELDRETCASKR